jgi:hypothetical protein
VVDRDDASDRLTRSASTIAPAAASTGASYRRPRAGIIESDRHNSQGASAMGKEHRSKKETKKKPAANLSEKRAAKKAKKEQRNSSGI